MAVQESIGQYKELNDTAEKHWQLFVQSIELSNKINISSFTEPQICQIKTILSLSEFVTEQLCRHPQWVIELIALSAAKSTISRKDYTDKINDLLVNVTDLEEVKKKLRDFRNKQMVRLAWMDYTNAITIEESLLNISALAESLVIAARDWLYTYMCSRYGTPMDDKEKPQPLMILGMGKLGGRELNYSSDIDLIFAFPEHGETQGARRSLENQEFFIRMAQKLINLLDQVTQDGFVYRVDMRLRPYGESGPLVVSFSALEDYYQEQGRDWERYALIKARALGPWTGYSDELHSLLRPFIYRRYIDYSAIDALRKMKQLIVTEVRRRQLDNNIKLGPGGIREAEFVVQSFQLIRGGQEPSLRQQSLLTALDMLQDLSLLNSAQCSELKKGYLFLRRIENLLQSIDDKQTQTLPSNVLDWQRLCYVLNVNDEISFRKKIQHEMSNINHHFCATIGGDKQNVSSNHWTALLWHEFDDAEAKKMLASHGLDDEALWPKLSTWRESVGKKSIGPRGRETLDKLLPRLLEELFQRPSPCHAFEPVSGVLDKILTRTTYLELLLENPNARQQLIHLCYVSPWIAKELANFPILLDDLINSKTLYKTLGFEGYKSELHQYLLRIPQDDMELQMEALRQFKLSQQLKIAAADVTGVLPVMKVSDHLTYLAEAIIEKVVILAWQQIIQKYGIPDHLSKTEMGFAVIAYGKLGGIELGYGSDLDLVFLHNAPASGNTLGDKSIGSSHFYLKLAQRILHLFSTRTVSGELYEVDMRLRPSGISGLLVSEIENFGQYQQSEAWTWEHQALVRARYVFGDLQLQNRFVEIRADILSIERDKKTLANEVNTMREKMREHLLKVKPDLFDLKQSKGGIADIEFIVQYLVLAYSHQDAGLTVYSDNVRILDYLSQLNIMTKAEANKISNIYCLLRDKSNSLILLEKSAKLPAKEVKQLCEPVVNLYNALLIH